MAVINDPGLNEIAHSIISEPGFSVSDQFRARRAWTLWMERTNAVQRLAAEQVLLLRWLQDMHAAFMRDQDRGAPAELRFRSESPGWQQPAVPGTADFPGGQGSYVAQAASAAGEQDSPQATPVPKPNVVAPAGSKTSRSQSATVPHSGSAAADNFPGGHPSIGAHAGAAAGEPPPSHTPSLPVIRPAPVPPVQQESRKVAAYQQMYPELGFRVQAAGGAKPLAEFTTADIRFRIGELGRERQSWRTENAGDEARVEDRERLNARDRVRIAERSRNIRDAEAEEERLMLAERELDGYDVAVIGELPPEALDACGFRRRVA